MHLLSTLENASKKLSRSAWQSDQSGRKGSREDKLLVSFPPGAWGEEMQESHSSVQGGHTWHTKYQQYPAPRERRQSVR